MIKIKKRGILLQKTSFDFENESVLNPAAIREGENVHLFYRAVSKGNYSTIGYCKLKGPLTVEERMDKPLLIPQLKLESQGMEDPRIVKIDDLYYLTYTAYDGVNALGALALSKDLKHFDRWGLVVPQITFTEFARLHELDHVNHGNYHSSNYKSIADSKDANKFIWDKDVIFFPRKINGEFYFLHRIKPDVQIIVSIKNLKDLTLEFWHNYFIHFNERIVLSPKYAHEINYIGGGCPPIETEYGWLLIYHGVQDSSNGFIYSACASLLDLQNPQNEIARLPYPLFRPEEEWETDGIVNNVCFPTGAALFEDTLYIYYGAADEQIACASVNISDLLKELMLYSKKDN